MVPVIVAKVPMLKNWNFPLDFGLQYKGKRVLGDHKTIRGLTSGIVVGILVAVSEQHLLGNIFGSNPAIIGFLLSFGALVGDSIKSFFKRQIGITPGAAWFPFDQLDYIVGGIVLSLFVVRLSIVEYITILVIYFFLHIVFTTIGYFLGFKSSIL